MKNLIIIFSVFFYMPDFANSQDVKFKWAVSNEFLIYDFTTDNFGNTYSVGIFEDTEDFDPGVGTYYLTSNGNFDMFIQKLDSSGNFVWARSIGGNGDDYVNAITNDELGNIYITGCFRFTVDFDPTLAGVHYITSEMMDCNLFIEKLNPSGNMEWVKVMETPMINGNVDFDAGSSGNNISIDPLGNIFIVGGFSSRVDFDYGTDRYRVTDDNGHRFVQKLDPNGNFLWVKTFSVDAIKSIAFDNSGNIYLGGYFIADTLDLDPGTNTFNVYGEHEKDIYILKLNNFGNFVWAKAMCGIFHDELYSIAVDDSLNVYSTGFFTDYIDIDPGVGSHYLIREGDNMNTSDVFIQKLDNNGNLKWAKSFGGKSSDHGTSILLDVYSNIYISGHFYYSIDLDPGDNEYILEASRGESDVFLQKLDRNGNFIWAKSIGGEDRDAANLMSLDKLGGVYLTGVFSDTLDFDPENEVYKLYVPRYSSFITKWDQIGYNDTTNLDTSEIILDTINIDTNNTNVDTSISIITESFSEIICLYPNPNIGNITINLRELSDKVRIELYCITGQLLKQEYYENTSLINFDIEEPAGLYFLNIVSNYEKKVTFKVIKK